MRRSNSGTHDSTHRQRHPPRGTAPSLPVGSQPSLSSTRAPELAPTPFAHTSTADHHLHFVLLAGYVQTRTNAHPEPDSPLCMHMHEDTLPGPLLPRKGGPSSSLSILYASTNSETLQRRHWSMTSPHGRASSCGAESLSSRCLTRRPTHTPPLCCGPMRRPAQRARRVSAASGVMLGSVQRSRSQWHCVSPCCTAGP